MEEIEEYIEVRVFLEGSGEENPVSVRRLSKIGNIKKYFSDNYTGLSVRFFINKENELKVVFQSNLYDNHDLSSVFDKMKDPFIILSSNNLGIQKIQKNIGIKMGRIRIAQQAKGRSYPSVPGFENIPAWSRGKGEWKELSPFFIRIPKYVEKETGAEFHNIIFEDFYQSFKVYEKVDKQNQKDWKWPAEIHVDANGNPNEKWWNWHSALLKHDQAVRRPNGKNIPLYSYFVSEAPFSALHAEKELCEAKFKSEKLGIVDARKQIYIPYLKELYLNHPVFQKLLQKVRNGINVMIIEPDGPFLDVYPDGLEVNLPILQSLIEVTNYAAEGYPHKYRPYGHGYVIAMALLQ